MTKRDKPAMSEEEFEKAIKELAQKEFATGKRDDARSALRGIKAFPLRGRWPEGPDEVAMKEKLS